MTTGNEPYRSLTPRQAQVMLFIQACVDKGVPPTHRDVVRRFGWGGTQASGHYFRSLARKGWIVMDPDEPRGIRLLRRLYPVAEVREGGLMATGEWLAVEVKK